MTDIKMIALDMDGTLLDDKKNITSATRNQILKAHESGIPIVLCTGRPMNKCDTYVKDLNLNTYLVTCNGGQVYSNEHAVIAEHLLASDTLADLYYSAQNLGMDTWVISTDEPYFNDLPENHKELQWLKFSCHHKDEAILDEMIQKLKYVNGVEISNASPINIEVNPVGVNKAMALELVCDRLGISMRNVMAVGDSLNDVTMIQKAEIGVAMKNAQEVVKQAADDVTDTNNKDGVGKAINKFILSAKV